MIRKNGEEILEIYHDMSSIVEMYRDKVLIWQATRSCFGSGYWINDRPWDNEDAWRNN